MYLLNILFLETNYDFGEIIKSDQYLNPTVEVASFFQEKENNFSFHIAYYDQSSNEKKSNSWINRSFQFSKEYVVDKLPLIEWLSFHFPHTVFLK